MLFLMSTTRSMAGGWADKAALKKGLGGRNLCRWCSLEVPARRLTFCSDFCVEEWKLRSSPGHLRERVFERDRGICARCGVDCQSALLHLKKARGLARLKLQAEWGVKGNRKSLWDADHIVPVVEGGGECDLSNMRTLCLRCHRTATAALRQRLKLTLRQGTGN
jgi:5-methylcytosine-specific restriction endonuclease McrA